MILLPQTKIEGAIIIGERIRAQVEATQLLPEAVLTISLGLIEFTANGDREDHLKRLDDALYEAKNGGRNQIKEAHPSISIKPALSLHLVVKIGRMRASFFCRLYLYV